MLSNIVVNKSMPSILSQEELYNFKISAENNNIKVVSNSVLSFRIK